MRDKDPGITTDAIRVESPAEQAQRTDRAARTEQARQAMQAARAMKAARAMQTSQAARTMSASRVIGTVVRGRIDRPLGSRHPRFPDLIYPVNYGYVEGVFAGDGEEQDVYLLGADEPLETFEGTVIAVWRRLDDEEDKWIVSADGRDYPDEEILARIRFQERYFKGFLIR